ncbi:MAG: hypothetical protein EXR07_12150 [Acetobacteraceae bacterium]|nr:hypothetical protein [Acetobacteraceae bacterium]
MVTGVTSPPATDPPGWTAEQTLISALEELRRAAEDIRKTLRGVNDDVYGTKLQQALGIATNLLAIHLPEPGYRVVGRLELLYRATRNLRPPVEDEDMETPTETRATIREALGALRMALDDALDAARRVYDEIAPIPTRRKALGAKTVKDQVDEVLNGLVAFQAVVNDIAREETTAPDFAQQGSLVRYYVREMTLEIDSANLHLTVSNTSLDLGALVHAIGDIREVTGTFRANVLDWWEYATETLLAGTEALQEPVNRLVTGVRALGGMIGACGSDGGPDMVLIPRGTFLMGIPPEESKREGSERFDKNAQPQREVTIGRPFLLGRSPVTVGEYAVFARETDRPREKPEFPQTDRHPAVNVGFADAAAYAAWLSERTGDAYRLPSEAEWEYACRAGTIAAQYWGDAWDPKMANAESHGTSEVGDFPANPWGLLDMLGNVWEWTEDTGHDDLRKAPRDGTAWTTGGSGRVLRGGSWNYVRRFNRAGYRVWGYDAPRSWVGFRLARTL